MDGERKRGLFHLCGKRCSFIGKEVFISFIGNEMFIYRDHLFISFIGKEMFMSFIGN